jgi:hypothetical protein
MIAISIRHTHANFHPLWCTEAAATTTKRRPEMKIVLRRATNQISNKEVMLGLLQILPFSRS